MKAKNSFKKTAAAAALVGVAGYVAGLLTAPKAGKETRADIRRSLPANKQDALEKAKLLYNEMDELLSNARDEHDNLTAKALTHLNVALDKAKSGRDKLEVVIESVKAGEGSDRDLNKAIKEAEKAVVHFKKFMLKK